MIYSKIVVKEKKVRPEKYGAIVWEGDNVHTVFKFLAGRDEYDAYELTFRINPKGWLIIYQPKGSDFNRWDRHAFVLEVGDYLVLSSDEIIDTCGPERFYKIFEEYQA